MVLVVGGSRAAGASAVACQGDVAVKADVMCLFGGAETALSSVSHMVNNAEIAGKSGRLSETSAGTIRACIDINVLGALWDACDAPCRQMQSPGDSARTIVISSVAASLGSPNEYVWYAASKGAIDSLTVGMAKELAPEGIRVNAVSPGMTKTEIHKCSTQDAGCLERLRPLIPLARIGEPEEVAQAVLFLMSDVASYITGANIPVSGGR